MTDTFYIGAYWYQRKQLLDEIIEPSIATLKGLQEFDDQFGNLYELGRSRKHALERKISITPEYIRKLYLKNVKKNDLDVSGYNTIGFRLSAWTGHQDYESSKISLNVGINSEKFVNRCLISIPSEGIARGRLLQIKKVKQTFDLIIEIWNPDYAVLTSRDLLEALDIMNEVGWVTYVKKLWRKPKISTKVLHEHDYLGGHLFYLNTTDDQAYDYSLINELLPLKNVLS